MSDKNIELMKKIIEAKKNSTQSASSTDKPQKTIGSTHKAFKNLKQGGVFDK